MDIGIADRDISMLPINGYIASVYGLLEYSS